MEIRRATAAEALDHCQHVLGGELTLLGLCCECGTELHITLDPDEDCVCAEVNGEHWVVDEANTQGLYCTDCACKLIP